MGNLEADSKYLKKAMIVNVVGTVLKVCGPLLTFVMARVFGAAEFGIMMIHYCWLKSNIKSE